MAEEVGISDDEGGQGPGPTRTARGAPPRVGVKVWDKNPNHLHFFSHDKREPTPDPAGDR
jgi:hypothetical protein